MNRDLTGILIRSASDDVRPMLEEWLCLNLQPEGDVPFEKAVAEPAGDLLHLYRGPQGWLVVAHARYHRSDALHAFSVEDGAVQFCVQGGYGSLAEYEWGYAVEPKESDRGLSAEEWPARLRTLFLDYLGIDPDAIHPQAPVTCYRVHQDPKRREKRKPIPPNTYRRFLSAVIKNEPIAFPDGKPGRIASFESYLRAKGTPEAQAEDYIQRAVRFSARVSDRETARRKHAAPVWKTIAGVVVVASILYVLFAALLSIIPAVYPWSWIAWGAVVSIAVLVYFWRFARVVRVPQVEVRFYDCEPGPETVARYRSEPQWATAITA